MLKFFYSEMGIGSKWKDIPFGKDPIKFISEYLREKYCIYDADNCGSDEFEVVVKNIETNETIFYIFNHSWWIEDNPHWELHDEWDYGIVDSVKFAYPSTDRDWLIL